MYREYAITFDSAGSQNFNNEIARNVIIFGVYNSSTSHSDKGNDNILILGEGSTFGINGSFGSKKSISLIKQTQNVVKIRIIMLTIVISLLMGKKSLSLKSTIKMLTFQWI